MVDGGAAELVSVGEFSGTEVLRNVHHQFHFVVLYQVEGADGSALFIGPEYRTGGHAVLPQIEAGAAGGVDDVSAFCQETAGSEDVDLLVGVSRGDEYPRSLVRYAVSYGDHRFQEGFVHVGTYAAHFSGGGHIDSYHGVSLVQAGEGELGAFYPDVSETERVGLQSGGLHPEHRLGGQIYKVGFQYLRYEREAARSTEVTFDDLLVAYSVFIASGEELDVERAGYVEFCGDGSGYFLYMCHGGGIEPLGGEFDGGVTGVDSCEFDVFGYGAGDYAASVGYGIHFHLLAAGHEGTYDHGVVFRHFHGHLKELAEVFLRVADIHGGSGEDV